MTIYLGTEGDFDQDDNSFGNSGRLRSGTKCGLQVLARMIADVEASDETSWHFGDGGCWIGWIDDERMQAAAGGFGGECAGSAAADPRGEWAEGAERGR